MKKCLSNFKTNCAFLSKIPATKNISMKKFCIFITYISIFLWEFYSNLLWFFDAPSLSKNIKILMAYRFLNYFFPQCLLRKWNHPVSLLQKGTYIYYIILDFHILVPGLFCFVCVLHRAWNCMVAIKSFSSINIIKLSCQFTEGHYPYPVK